MSTTGQSDAGPSASAPATSSMTKVKAPPRPVPAMLKPLQFMGVPRGILTWQPRLPSRNWSIFWGLTISISSLYIYDRRECKRIKQEYIDQLSHLAKEPLKPNEYPRKVAVYTARSPGDEDYEKSLLFFKLYVKPFLVAAGIDWSTTNGTRHGGLARELRERHFSRRRQLAGLEPWGTPPSTATESTPDPIVAGLTPFSLTPQQQLQQELDGGVILVGRPAYKEWAWGLREGWTTRLPPKRQDLDDELARILSDDGAFDEIEEPKKEILMEDEFEKNNLALTSEDGVEPDGAGAPLPSRLNSTGNRGPISFNPAFQPINSSNSSTRQPKSNAEEEINVNPKLLEAPSEIPAQPPITFVDYVNLTGFRHVPRKIVGFFRHRDRFLLGGQAAMNLALGDKSNAREYEVVLSEEGQLASIEPPQGGDLDWGLNSERFYLPKFNQTIKDVEKAKENFYSELKRRLQDTRSYVRGQRELTATEKNDPPKSESDLREERFRKEKEWRLLTQGYEILKPSVGVIWHPAFKTRLRVYQHQDKRPSPVTEKTEL
ncbi:hypothetical protein L7F22_053976 [Adiantum nelumboides]|nr:hypothetical protein [Adiantum nelumboides]